MPGQPKWNSRGQRWCRCRPQRPMIRRGGQLNMPLRSRYTTRCNCDCGRRATAAGDHLACDANRDDASAKSCRATRRSVCTAPCLGTRVLASRRSSNPWRIGGRRCDIRNTKKHATHTDTSHPRARDGDDEERAERAGLGARAQHHVGAVVFSSTATTLNVAISKFKCERAFRAAVFSKCGSVGERISSCTPSAPRALLAHAW